MQSYNLIPLYIVGPTIIWKNLQKTMYILFSTRKLLEQNSQMENPLLVNFESHAYIVSEHISMDIKKLQFHLFPSLLFEFEGF